MSKKISVKNLELYQKKKQQDVRLCPCGRLYPMDVVVLPKLIEKSTEIELNESNAW